MKKPYWMLGLLLPLAGTAAAQSAGACPYLDANTGLTWQHQTGPGFDFCRAIKADGTEVFGVYIAREAPFKPVKANRAEEVTIDGREVTWYRAEIAGTKLQARETLVDMPDGRVAHISVQAKSPEALTDAMQHTQALKFGSTRLSSN